MSSVFADWRIRREKKAVSDRAKRRKEAKRKALEPKPKGPQPETITRVCRVRLKVRSTWEMDSEETGEIHPSTRVRVLDRRKLPDGIERAHISVLESATSGWVTWLDKDGCPNLLEVTRTHVPHPEVARWIASLNEEKRAIEEAWNLHLSATAFRVCRMKGTDDAHAGPYTDHFENGSYTCAACGRCLYLSSHKFSSTCGWPSFSDNVEGALARVEGRSVEIVCASCGSHVGHVYHSPFHPSPRHERHCANSSSLRFVPSGRPAPPPAPVECATGDHAADAPPELSA